MGRRVRKTLSIVLVLAFILTMIPSTLISAATAPTISKTSQYILVGKSYDFNIKNKVAKSTYKWSSSDVKIATVSKVGLVKGIAKGTAKITCKVTAAGKTYTLTTTAKILVAAKSIAISNGVGTMKVGDTLNLNRTLSPKSSNDKTTWTSSDKSIANPDKLGKFTALKGGEVTITATTVSGATDYVTITVADNDLTITSADVKNGKVKLSNKIYSNLKISSSVGTASITLDNIKVIGNLTLENGAAYTVTTQNSEINNVEVVKPELATLAIQEEAIPTLVAGRGTIIVTIDAQGSITLQQNNMADIGSFTITPDSAGNITISMDGFKGDIVIDSAFKSDITIETNNCEIGKATIANTLEGDKVSFVDKFAGTASASSIGTVNVESNAKVSVDVKTKEVFVASTVKNVSVAILQPVEKITNNAVGTSVTTSGAGTITKSEGTNPVVKVTPTPTPTAVPSTPSTPGTPSTPTTPTTPGIVVNNGVYTFDSHVTGFTVKIGSNSYLLNYDKVIAAALAWDDKAAEYDVPNTSPKLTLKRVEDKPFTYDVVVANLGTFRMAVAVDQSITVTGGPTFSIESVVRYYPFSASTTSITVRSTTDASTITATELAFVRTAWANDATTYTYAAKNILFTRTATPYLYKVKAPGIDEFTMLVDVNNFSVTITGGVNFTIDK